MRVGGVFVFLLVLSLSLPRRKHLCLTLGGIHSKPCVSHTEYFCSPAKPPPVLGKINIKLGVSGGRELSVQMTTFELGEKESTEKVENVRAESKLLCTERQKPAPRVVPADSL